MSVRRVVTGFVDGITAFVEDSAVSPTSFGEKGGGIYAVYAADRALLPGNVDPAAGADLAPAVGGFRTSVLQIPAHDDRAWESFVTQRFGPPADQALLGGMHATPTVDVCLVTTGSVVLQLDSGVETALSAGDIVVQNGTPHRWQNRSNDTAVIMFTLIGASIEGKEDAWPER
jgi:hypothetical protein